MLMQRQSSDCMELLFVAEAASRAEGTLPLGKFHHHFVAIGELYPFLNGEGWKLFRHCYLDGPGKKDRVPDETKQQKGQPATSGNKKSPPARPTVRVS